MSYLAERIVLASGNAGKLAELQQLLSPLAVTLVRQSELGIDEADETGLTFLENAILKARHASRLSGLPALADDSGLAVDALGGAPGIYSARYAEHELDGADDSLELRDSREPKDSRELKDSANNRKLLAALSGVPDAERSARFHCILVYLRHADDPVPLVCHGQWAGRILHEPAGAGGFGYDPLFWVPDQQCSSAELPAAVKNRLSHRGQAMQQLLAQLNTLATPPGGPR